MADGKKEIEWPSKGFLFWPVGNGDSTTIVVMKNEITIQVDLHHLSSSEDEGDPHFQIVDELINGLPMVNGKPYLSLLVLTHPDEDHCLGFSDLLRRVKIGEIWFAPRIFREFQKDLCDDAKAFKKEAQRRVKKTINEGSDVPSGDRVRIIGYDELLDEEEFEGFPKDRLTIPGNPIYELDGKDCTEFFRAFIHAPFKVDSAGERNETSVAMQVRLTRNGISGQALLFGDLSYPTVRKIFDVSDSDDLGWNIFLSPHHCSKSVMYQIEGDQDQEVLKQDILDSIEQEANSPGYILSSSEPIPSSNKTGDNPPHAKAKNRYEEITPDDFLCTQEHPNKENPEPIIFELTNNGIEYVQPKGNEKVKKGGLLSAVSSARGATKPPTERVGFGR